VTAGEVAAEARAMIHSGAPVPVSARTNDRVNSVPSAPDLAGIWPRSAAVLARQALEQGLDDFWGARAPRVREVSRHAQLLCLGAYLQDDDVVSGVRYAWHGLSRACHHQVYELPPTATELERWLDAVDALVAHDPMGAKRG
jgi:hypothetical protein